MAVSRSEAMHSTRLAPDAAGANAAAVSPGPAGQERRRSTRESQLTVATLQPANGDASIELPVLVCNLSLGGVGFRASQRFQAGQTYRITLGAGPLFLNARLTIVSCRARADGTFDVGAAFC
jgi:hypothetical protein